MKNSKKGFIVSMVIAVIAILLIGGGIYVYNKNKEVVQTSISTTASTTTEISTNQPTENWKIHTNTQLGFSVQYPPVGGVTDVGMDSEGGYVYIVGLSSNSAVSKSVRIKVASISQANSCTKDFYSISTTSVAINGINFIKGQTSEAVGVRATGIDVIEYCVTKNNNVYRLIINPNFENDADVKTTVNSFTITSIKTSKITPQEVDI